MPKTDHAPHRRSSLALGAAAKVLKKTSNDVWKAAFKAPMSFKKQVKDPKGNIKKQRSKRLIAAHTFKIMASGAAARAAAVLRQEQSVYRLPGVKEHPRAPWVPSMSRAAALLMEHYIVAYGQHAFRHASNIRKGLGGDVKRVSPAMMRAGFAQANEDIFGMGTPAPRVLYVGEVDSKKGKKKAAACEEEEEARGEGVEEDE